MGTSFSSCNDDGDILSVCSSTVNILVIVVLLLLFFITT